MSRQYPRGKNFVRKSFHQFFTNDTVTWFQERGVRLKTEEDGRMFPVTDSSQTIIDCLLKEAEKYNVEIMMQHEVRAVKISSNNAQNDFIIQLSNNKIIHSEYLCIACGGYAKTSMFNWLLETGHNIEEPVPSLFTFNLPGNDIRSLMGISVDRVSVKISGTKLREEGPVLITHWGLSGPAILRLSAWGARILKEKNYEFEIHVNWLLQYNEEELRDRFHQLRDLVASQKVVNKNTFGIPQRLWAFIVNQAGINENLRWSDLPSKKLNLLIELLKNSVYRVKGKTTFKEEFVTAGGIRLNEINPNTMQSKIIPGLYFAGEIMDVDGITGGYNFQHAWTSGFIASLLR
jgi:predicted Rossmann fold flavoprotein